MITEKRSTGDKISTVIISILIVLIYLFPFYIVINVSLRDVTDLTSRLFPTKDGDMENYTAVINNKEFWTSFINTIIYCAMDIFISIPIAALGGYGLARSKNVISDLIRSSNILVMMIPGTALLVGTYGLMVKLHLTNSLFGMALLGAGGAMCGEMFFYTTFTTMIPVDLDEAAAIDGASVVRTYFKIIFPQLKAITVTRVINIVIGCWNNYLMPMYLLQRSQKFTILLFVRKLFNSSVVQSIPLAFAGCFLMIIPILAVYFSMQKYIVGSQLDSAVKG